jgi:predicted lipoprotein
MPKFKVAAALVVAGVMALSGCKIIKTPTAEEAAEAASGGFNPGRMVAEIWDAKVLPYLDRKAGPFAEVAALAESDPQAAGAKYGHKEKQGSAPLDFCGASFRHRR